MNQPSAGYRLVSDQSGLEQRCQNWLTVPQLAIDTEFVRTRTYFAQLGLIQVSDGQEIWLVDATSVVDWAPLAAVFGSESVTKIIHAGGEDLPLLERVCGAMPRPVCDTQVAATLAGIGGNLSYQNLVSRLLDIHVDKGQTRSDWLRRPLSEKQLHYAADDVRYLLRCNDLLEQELNSMDRVDWWLGECSHLLDSASAEPGVADIYARFGRTWSMDAEQRSRLWRLCEWREETASARDLPRNWLLKNNVISTLATRPVTSVGALNRVDGVDARTVRRHGRELLELLALPVMEPPPDKAPEPLNQTERTRLKALKVALSERAEALSIPPDFLATRRDLEQVARGITTQDVFGGWRAEVLKQTFTDA